MTDYATLPLQAHDNRSAFLEHAWNIGRAYRNRAIELISICQFLSRFAPPTFSHQDTEVRRLRSACDIAIRSAAESGTKTTDEANTLFKRATKVLSNYSKRKLRLDPQITVYSKMEIAKSKDGLSGDWPREKSDDSECTSMVIINFVLLLSPLLSPHDPETIIVSQGFGASPPLPEILWNFGRYKDHALITLEQNPHFYLRCPANESAYTPMFRRHPLQDTSVLEHNDTVYVLFDRPSRVFLHTENRCRIFGNVWLLNGSLIFRDSSGVLEGETFVRDSGTRYILRYCEHPVVCPWVYHDSGCRSRLNDSNLWPIITTPSANPSSDGAFEDWTILSHPAPHSIDVHIFGLRGSPGYTNSLGPPPPPTSERPEYRVLYKSQAISMLNDDILLAIFNYYRVENEYAWNVQLGWCKISHVCQRWRQLVYSSASHLSMHILCTHGTPMVATLNHLPPLPLFVEYLDHRDLQPEIIGSLWRWSKRVTMTANSEDELGIHHALRLRDRVRRVALHLPPSFLRTSLMIMDKPFPILDHLSLSFIGDEVTSLTLPQTFLAPNILHLALVGIRIPKRLRLLTSAVSLVTLKLTDIRASGYFHPRLLVARLQSLPQLEELTIEFSIPIPRPSAERLLLGNQRTPVVLSNLKILRFRGVSAYLERLVSQIRAPVLEYLCITLFNQIAFTLPHLSRIIVNITEEIKGLNATIDLGGDASQIILSRRNLSICFILRVMCQPMDWQIDCAAQICSALMPALSVVENLSLHNDSSRWITASELDLDTDEIDGTTWHELFCSFIGVKELRIDHFFLERLSRPLEVDETGLDLGLLPDLQVLVSDYHGRHAGSLIGTFIHARLVVGRPVSLRPPRPPPISRGHVGPGSPHSS